MVCLRFAFNLPCEVAIARYSPSKLGSTLAYSQLFDSTVLFNITLAGGNLRTSVIPKQNRHYLNDNEQPFRHRKKGKRCLSGVFYVAVSTWKASPFTPDA